VIHHPITVQEPNSMGGRTGGDRVML